MHLIYTLIAGGLLVLTRLPAEQPPPRVSDHIVAYTEGIRADEYHSASDSVPTDVLIDRSGEGNSTLSAVTNLTPSGDFLPIQFQLDNFEIRRPSELQGDGLPASPAFIPVDFTVSVAAASPTPSPAAKTTTVDSVMQTYRQPSSLPASGYAMFYNPNVMQEVLSNRLAMGHVSACNECVGNVALLRAGDLNRHVWLQWADGTVEGPFLVVDVAASKDVASLLARHWVVDVDNSTAVRRGMAGPVPVTVWASPPSASQEKVPPFAPLYSAQPAEVTALQTQAPVESAAPAAVTMQSDFPADTQVPTVTPLPPLDATLTPTVVTVQGAFPTNTLVPANTSLPAPDATPTPIPTLVQRGFPTDTPVPTVTPLPALNATAIATVLPAQTALATATPTWLASATLSPSPTAVVTYGGFPPDTPVPTITPLPALNATPTAMAPAK